MTAEQPGWITTAAEVVWDSAEEGSTTISALRAISQNGAVETVRALIEAIGCASDFDDENGPSKRQRAEMRTALALAKQLLVAVELAEVAQ